MIKHIKKFFLSLIVLFLLLPTPINAQKGGNDSSYSYTITLYSGNLATFPDGSTSMKFTYNLGDNPANTLQRAAYSISFKDNYGNIYYVKGVRESGKDNNTVARTSYEVDSDREYVVAYGIKGDMVSYTVQYLDYDGNVLYPSDTFYGVVGDEPVVAFQYIDGYVPYSYNISKTLTKDESQNIFTFYYMTKEQKRQQEIDEGTRVIDSENGEENSDSENSNTNDNDSDKLVPSSTPYSYVDLDDNSSDSDSNQNEYMNVDDNNTPLANILKDKNMLLLVGLSSAAILALVFFFIFIFKKKKKNKEDQNLA